MFGENKVLNSCIIRLQKSVECIKCKSKDVAMINWHWYKLTCSETLSHSISPATVNKYYKKWTHSNFTVLVDA